MCSCSQKVTFTVFVVFFVCISFLLPKTGTGEAYGEMMPPRSNQTFLQVKSKLKFLWYQFIFKQFFNEDKVISMADKYIYTEGLSYSLPSVVRGCYQSAQTKDASGLK